MIKSRPAPRRAHSRDHYTRHTSTLSTPLIPLPRIVHTPFPIHTPQVETLNDRHEPQRNSHAGPQAFQPPSQSERRAHTNRHRNRIVAEKLHVATHLLSAQSAQDAIAASGGGVEELEGGDQGEDFGDEPDDVGV